MEDILQVLNKSRTGKKHDMETLEGYYFYPLKYSVEAVEQMESIIFERVGDKKGLMNKISKTSKDGKLKESEIISQLDGKDLKTLYKATEKGLEKDKEYLSIILKYGIGENNFGGNVKSEGALIQNGIPQSFIDGLLNNVNILNEIVSVIKLFNAPLNNSQ